MAFPASTITQQEAWDGIRKSASLLKTRVNQLSALSASGDTSRSSYISLLKILDTAIDQWVIFAAVPNLEVYARNQLADQTIDITIEYSAMRAAAISLRDWLFNVLPTDSVTGAILEQTVDVNGTRTELVFTTVQTAQFRTNVTALVVTIG